MISMSKVNDIRRLRREGETVASIARRVGVSRDTVYKYLSLGDLSPKAPVRGVRRSRLDPYRPLIEHWLDEDRENWRKQRHTAHRIWVRLTEEEHVQVSEARVRQYVRMVRDERRPAAHEQMLDLEWAPGTAQADFGEADFYLRGTRARLSYFVLSFPFSNVGLAQVYPSENAECVCQALRNVFEFVGGVPVLVQGDVKKGFVTEAEDLAPYVTERTKALILNSPNNPNGCIWNREQLAGIAKLAVEKGFYVVSDEIYEKLIYDGQKHVSIAELGEAIKNQTFVVNGMSKAYAMTGWRIGYVAGPRNEICAMTSFQSHATSNANSIAQYAAMKALQGDPQCVTDMVAQFEARRNAMVEKINSIPGLSCMKPQGAFYIMLNITGVMGKTYNGRVIDSSQTFAELLLADKHVAVVPGNAFEAEGFCRLSYAVAMESCMEGLRRIEEFVSELK